MATDRIIDDSSKRYAVVPVCSTSIPYQHQTKHMFRSRWNDRGILVQLWLGLIGGESTANEWSRDEGDGLFMLFVSRGSRLFDDQASVEVSLFGVYLILASMLDLEFLISIHVTLAAEVECG